MADFDITKLNKYPRVALADDTLVPAVSPHSQVATVTTWGKILSKIKDIFSRNKGYFSSVELLNQTYPAPATGYTAYVADSASPTGYYIYNSADGAWVATTTPAPVVNVNLNDYVPKSAIQQSLGTSETDVMSQKAVNDALSALSGSSGGGAYLPLTGGTIVGNVFQKGLYTFKNSDNQKPVTFGFQMNNELGREVFNIANSDNVMSVLGLILAGNLRVGNSFGNSKQVWHEGNLTKLSQLENDLEIGGGGVDLSGYLPLTGGTINGNIFQTGLYTFRNSENKKPVTFGYQMNNEVGREIFHIANSDNVMSVLGLILAGNLRVGNSFGNSKQVWHEGNLTKLSQLQDDLSKYLPLSGGSNFKMQRQIHWEDLDGGTTAIGCPGVSDQPHFFFKSTSYDWRFDKNIKIKIGQDLNGEVYSQAVLENRTINGKPLSDDVTLVARDVGASALGHTHNSIIETYASKTLKFATLTQAQYNAIVTKNPDTLYIITDADAGRT